MGVPPMPGPFVHLALTESLCQRVALLSDASPIGPDLREALCTCRQFCMLGSVSPDVPYLAPTRPHAEAWANVMHYWRTTDIVRAAIPLLPHYKATPHNWQKSVAWLFGYVSHVVADLTLHPVSNANGWDYSGNRHLHKVSELHQDSHTFFTRHGEMSGGMAGYLKASGLDRCGNMGDPGHLDPAIVALWRVCLDRATQGTVTMKEKLPAPLPHSATPDEWYQDYMGLLQACLDAGDLLPVNFRNAGERAGFLYPEKHDVDPSYTRGLLLPGGGTGDYDGLLLIAENNILQAWQMLGAALTKEDPALFSLPNADLDTGLAPEGTVPHYWPTGAAKVAVLT